MPVPISCAALLFNRQDEAAGCRRPGFLRGGGLHRSEGEDGGCGQGSQDPTRQEGGPQARAQDRKPPLCASSHPCPLLSLQNLGAARVKSIYAFHGLGVPWVSVSAEDTFQMFRSGNIYTHTAVNENNALHHLTCSVVNIL